MSKTLDNAILDNAIKLPNYSKFVNGVPLHERCPYAEFLFVFSPNAGKYGPGKLRIRTLFTQCTFFRLPLLKSYLR